MSERIKTVALYSGWGIEPKVRNFGDELCFQGGKKLLGAHGISVIDIKPSIDAYTEDWTGTTVIGGGTVLPTVFENWVAPGLKTSSEIFVFGSGVLSQEELDNKHIEGFDRIPYRRTRVIGVRGPLSAKYYLDLFGERVDFIGDLGFAFAEDESRRNIDGHIAFFIIENNLSSSRINGDYETVLEAYLNLSKNLSSETKRLFVTDRRELPSEREPRALGEMNPVPLNSLEEFIQVIKDAKVVVTERFHPAVIAANFGIPFVYIKTTTKAHDLEQLMIAEGFGEHVDNLFVNPGDINLLGEKINALLTSQDLAHDLNAFARRVKDRLESAAVLVTRGINQDTPGSS